MCAEVFAVTSHALWHYDNDISFLYAKASKFATYLKQDAQLSQRDRAAGCVIVFAKSTRLELGDNMLQTL